MIPTSPPIVLTTPRLVLRRLATQDAEFILELLTQPSFVRYIGDKGVRTADDARQYLETGPLASYARFGFGLYLVELAETSERIGICGLLKRDTLDDVDLGFALLERFWSRGFAFESASAVLSYGRQALGLRRIVAITSPDNAASIALLAKLGFRFERLARLSPGEPEVRLFCWTAENV